MPMVRPIGGRGKRAPYETVMVRVPEPIKPDVERLIARYRAEILLEDNSGESSSLDEEKLAEFRLATKLVNRFIKEIGQEESLHQRNNRNLVRFREWLESKTNANS